MFHFTIRDVLWLTVVVAMGAGWWLEHRAAIRQEAACKRMVTELGLEMAAMSMELGQLRGVKPLTEDNNDP